MKKQPWIHSASFDLIWFHLPTIVVLLIIWLLPTSIIESTEMSPWFWLLFIAGIDVSHVYSTLFRTYFHSEQFVRNKQLFILIPLICFVIAVFLYSLSSIIFWRVLAYLAVFHFIRQQYGFLRIYSRKESLGKLNSIVDKMTIYSATLYPIVYWHLCGDRVFKWFVENDFVLFSNQHENILGFIQLIYLAIISTWLATTCFKLFKYRIFNIPKFIWITSTILSWYFGIVYFNSDLVFTMLNVVAHGIPYMALVWHYSGKEKPSVKFDILIWREGLNKSKSLVIFILILLFFGIIEEALWDSLVWQDHSIFFGFLYSNINLVNSREFQSLIIPVLALPQMVHYVLDGFIWRVNKPNHLQFFKE